MPGGGGLSMEQVALDGIKNVGKLWKYLKSPTFDSAAEDVLEGLEFAAL